MKLAKIAKKAVVLFIAIFMIILLFVPLANRYVYDTWNVCAYPNRVTFKTYDYSNIGRFVTLTGDKKPKYEISGFFDKVTGKRVYSNIKNFQGDYGTNIYLHIRNDKYLVLSCGGQS